jgi:hypothetical protein
MARVAVLAMLLAMVLVLALLPMPARANSVFASGGLGEPELEENARLRALGGAGVAEHGASDFSLVNPASIAEAQHLILEASLLAARRNVSTLHFGDETASETTFPSVRLVVRLPGAWILGGSFLHGTNGQFGLVRPESTGAPSVVEVDGRGGITYVRATLAKGLGPSLRLGVDFDVIGGSYHEEWERDFTIPGSRPRATRSTSRGTGSDGGASARRSSGPTGRSAACTKRSAGSPSPSGSAPPRPTSAPPASPS